MYVAAILAQVAARRAAGDPTTAHALAELAASQARTSGVTPDMRRRALDQLGTLKHQKGELDEAARLLRGAADEFDSAPVAGPAERAAVLNELGAVQIGLKDYVTAERTLLTAQDYATDAIKVRVMNNLGAVAALRGDRRAAERYYQSARALAGESAALAADRAAIDRNLTGIGIRR
jgi:tetratricopeptide (TPR) repeat protein